MKAILLGGGLALLFSLLGTRAAIPLFTQLGYGQEIRDDGPTSHHTKRGTPTMGGVVIIASAVLAYFLADLITQTKPSASALLLLFLFVGMGVVGFLDDFIKVSKQRSLGLRSKAKMVGQTVIALVFGWLALSDDARGRPRRQLRRPDHLSFIRDSELVLADDRRDPAVLGDDHRHQQRGEPHRRPRRPRHRCLRDGVRRLHVRQHLAEQPELRDPPRARPATRCATRSTSPWSRRPSPAPASGSCGGTRHRPRSSWATPGRCRSAARWPGFAILTRTELLLVISAACSS